MAPLKNRSPENCRRADRRRARDFGDRRRSSGWRPALTVRRLGRSGVLVIRGRFIGFDKSGSEQRQKNFVMAGNGVTARFFGFGFAIFAGRAGGGALDDVLQRAIVLEEIEIGRGDGTKRRAEIADHGDGFEKNLGQNDGGSPVEIHAAGMHFANECAE